MEQIIKADSLHSARRLLANLINQCGKFSNGGYPYIGTLSKSYGYNKKIGMTSFDCKIKYRINWDPYKGVHYNFVDEDYKGTGSRLNICILIKGMTYEQYKIYVDKTNKGFIMQDYQRISFEDKGLVSVSDAARLYHILFDTPHQLYPAPDSRLKKASPRK